LNSGIFKAVGGKEGDEARGVMDSEEIIDRIKKKSKITKRKVKFSLLTVDDPNEGEKEEDALPSDPPSVIIQRALLQTSSANQWLADLLTASKKKELTGENVSGYYASLGRTDVKGGPIAKLMNSIANFVSDQIGEEAFRNQLTDNEFMRYHTSRVSTGKLLFEMMDVFTDLGILDLESDDYNNIKDSNDRPYDISISKKIPSKLVGYAALYFEVCGKDVGTWFQGMSALNKLPSIKIKTIKQVFKKYLELKNSLVELDGVNELEDLKDIVSKGFF
jgi:hypothetical protein